VSESLDVSSVLWINSEMADWRFRSPKSTQERLIANPGSDNIRQLLPWRPSSIVATADRKSDERTAWRCWRDSAGAAALLTAGAITRSRRLGVTSEGSLVDHVASQLGYRHAYGIVLCGPPRANQKPVVQLHDRRGRTLAYIKVAWNGLTLRLLDDEYAALTHLGSIAEKGFSVPDVLARGIYGNASWLALAPIVVERRAPPDARRVDALAIAIERTGSSWAGRTADAGYISRLVAMADGLAEGQRAVERLLDRWSEQTIQLGASHGDFVPWNMLSGSPESAVWDWERYQTAAPIGFDRLHFRIQTVWHRDRTPLDDALRQLAQRLDEVLPELPCEEREAQLDWYVADLLCRYERDAHAHPTRLPGHVANLTTILKERHAAL
jgi:hypothetical protein